MAAGESTLKNCRTLFEQSNAGKTTQQLMEYPTYDENIDMQT